jgi:hypothetical protein
MTERDTNERGGPLGGQELPPEVQDRPEQNRGYDEAVERRDVADRADEGRGAPAPDKAEGER